MIDSFVDWSAHQLSLWVDPSGAGLLLFMAVFMGWPMWFFLMWMWGGGFYYIVRAITVFNLVAGIGAALLAIMGVWPFTTMFGDAAALFMMGIVGLFMLRFVVA